MCLTVWIESLSYFFPISGLFDPMNVNMSHVYNYTVYLSQSGRNM